MTTKTSFPGSGIGDLEANRSGRISREHALRMTWRALAGSVVGLAVGAFWSSLGVRSGNGMLTLIALAIASVGASDHILMLASGGHRHKAIGTEMRAGKSVAWACRQVNAQPDCGAATTSISNMPGSA